MNLSSARRSLVERDVPIYRHLSSRLDHLERQPCVCYSISRKRSSSSDSWAFLQRDAENGAQYPNGWFYRSDTRTAMPGLDVVLKQIAIEWTEEYLEFEGDAKGIRAYWNEWGGPELVAEIVDWMEALDAAA